ncbi:MAG: flagellar basal body rod C-terminal domain-containing protein [Rhodospirillales bacterium]
MSLDAALGIASQSLVNINQGFGVISNNIANAQTAGYAAEQATQRSVSAGGVGMGVASGATRLATDQALQAGLYEQNAMAAGWNTTSSALGNVQPVLGTVGQGNDLGSLIGALQNSFSALLNDPADQTQQGAVVGAAQGVARQVNSLSAAYGSARQDAQNGLVGGVATLNKALGAVGALSQQIVSLQAHGGSTAALENQRNAALTTISGLVDARFAQQPNGDVLVFTTGGAQLPTSGGTPISIATANAGSGSYYPGGGLPGIMLGNSDITAQLKGGAIGANVTLRDQTLPTYQGEIDQFAQTLAGRFDAQGLTLFSDPHVPAGGGAPVQNGYVGFASAMTVNPAVVALPSLVRDGTHAVTGSATGASAFTPNPGNLAGFSGMIDRVLNFALGAEAQTGVAQAAPATSGLGPAGTLAAPFSTPATMEDFATSITASQSAESGDATAAAGEAHATQGTLAGNLKSETGVDVDSQLALMVQLQNAYGANAKIISTVQQMFSSLLAAVQ